MIVFCRDHEPSMNESVMDFETLQNSLIFICESFNTTILFSSDFTRVTPVIAGKR